MSCISFVVTVATSLRNVLQFQDDEEVRLTSQEFDDILRKVPPVLSVSRAIQ